jgi:hypothetical protein
MDTSNSHGKKHDAMLDVVKALIRQSKVLENKASDYPSQMDTIFGT